MKQLSVMFCVISALFISNITYGGQPGRMPASANVKDDVGRRSADAQVTATQAAVHDNVAPVRGVLGNPDLLQSGARISRQPAQNFSTTGSNLNVPGTYLTIQAAINAAANGDTINVYPGTYQADSANGFDPSTGGAGANDFNIFVNKSVTIRGVDALGAPITSTSTIAANVIASRDLPTFGADAFYVQADNVTITGLHIVGFNSPSFNNKTVEIGGDNFTMKYCNVEGLDQAAAIYLSDPHFDAGTTTSHVQSYRIEANTINGGGPDADGVRISSGAGWSGSVSNRVITGNTFTDAIDHIAFVGPGADPWDVYPVGAATVTANSFSGAARRHVIAWGLYNSAQGYADPDWDGILASNTFDRGAVLRTPSNAIRSWDLPSSGFYYVRGLYTTIQRYAINKAQGGDHVDLLAGSYIERLTVNTPLTITGAGQGSTFLYPDTSDPGTPSGPAFSNAQMIVINASDVTISGLTLDGNNPSISSSVTVNGVDIDARNGIIESNGPWNNTTVYNTTVKNIYLRGIYARSGGSGFNFHDNIVENVMGCANSIAMFNFGGSGTFAGNTVSLAGDAISANHSRGTQFLNNTITTSLSGVHTDNAGDGGGSADLIQGNTVSNSPAGGYGVWVFVPYIAPTVRDNNVTNVEVGLGSFGGAFAPSPTVTVLFERNTVDGQGKANSLGFYFSNSTFWWGVTSVAATLSNSFIANNAYGVYLESANGYTLNLTAHANSITGNTAQVHTDSVPSIYGGTGSVGTVTADLRGIWWGGVSVPVITGPSAGSVAYSPWLGLGTDADLGTSGFQPVAPMTWYTNTSATLQSAVDFAAGGDVLNVLPGTFTEQVEITKALTVIGSGTAATTIQSPVTLTKYFMTSSKNYPIVYAHDADNIVVRSLTVDGAGRGNGNYRFIGLGYYNAGGTVDLCRVKDVRETPINGTQHGVGIYAYVDNATPRALNVTGDTLFGFQKNAMALNGNNLTATVTGNVATGAGAVNFIAQNGIQIGFGATGSITNNSVTGVSYTPATDVASGLLLYAPTGPVFASNNTVTEAQVGIYYINTGGTISGNTVSASAAGCGTPVIWGVDVDPGASPRVKPSPFDQPAGTAVTGRTAMGVSSTTTSVRGNTMTGDGTSGTGLEMDALGTEALIVDASQNAITGWGYGVYFYKDAGATLAAVVDTNTIAGNVYGAFDQTGVLQDARYNWWGSASGPRDVKTLPAVPNYNNPAGTGDSVSAYVDYNPWFLDAGKTTPSIYTLTVNALHGSVVKNPDQPTYLHGTPVQLTATPATGYNFTSWSGDAGGSANPVTVAMNGNKTVTANFTIITYTISSSAGANGSISPAGATPVIYGDSLEFFFTPSIGYHVDSLFVDDVLQPAAASHKFTNVTGNHTIRVTFAIDQFTITPSAGANGTISPSVPTSVGYGGNLTFNFAPSTGYHIDSVIVDGVSQPVAASYEFTNITGNHAIRVTFAIDLHVITTISGPNGSISPPGPVSVPYGGSQTFHFTPLPNYVVDSVIVDNVYFGSDTSYVFTSVTLDHTLRVTFALAPPMYRQYRTFTYAELQVKKPAPRKAVTNYWEFKIKNTTGSAISQVNVIFKNDVLQIISTGSLSASGFGRTWSFSGQMLPNDSVTIQGRSPKPTAQVILRLWFDPSSGMPFFRNVLPTVNVLEYPMPNTANVREEAFRQGAFTATSGCVVGLVLPQYSRDIGWVRMTTPTMMYKSIFDRAVHTGTPRGFDYFNNFHPFVREQRGLRPQKQNNLLFADLLALKLNIMISRIGLTPRGFGELRYVDPGNPWSSMLIRDIAAAADSLMTMHQPDPVRYYVLDTTVQRLNRAFSGPFDTISFKDSLRITGVREVMSVLYLEPTNVPPIVVAQIANGGMEVPKKFELFQNYPNPFNPTTTIRFALTNPGLVTLKVYDLLGRQVATLLDREAMEEGVQETDFDAYALASGVYWYRISVESTDDNGTLHQFSEVKKMLLMK